MDNNSQIIQNVLLEHLKHSKRTARWSIILRLLLFIYLGFALFFIHTMRSSIAESGNQTLASPHVAVITIRGAIADDPKVSASADRINQSLRRAFDQEHTMGVILRINSPGGSPVQSQLIYSEINRLRAKHPDKPLYAIAGDIAASGGYYIASAADEIYANPNSLVGSIGVIMGGFGFSDLIGKLGVDRRVYTAGNDKALMDPFLPESIDTVDHVGTLLDSIHQNFINAVKQGRGVRLKAEDSVLFNGLIWTGDQAVELGLIDGLSGTRELAETKFGLDVKLMNYSSSVSPLERIINRIGAQIYDVYHITTTSFSFK